MLLISGEVTRPGWSLRQAHRGNLSRRFYLNWGLQDVERKIFQKGVHAEETTCAKNKGRREQAWHVQRTKENFFMAVCELWRLRCNQSAEMTTRGGQEPACKWLCVNWGQTPVLRCVSRTEQCPVFIYWSDVSTPPLTRTCTPQCEPLKGGHPVCLVDWDTSNTQTLPIAGAHRMFLVWMDDQTSQCVSEW